VCEALLAPERVAEWHDTTGVRFEGVVFEQDYAKEHGDLSISYECKGSRLAGLGTLAFRTVISERCVTATCLISSVKLVFHTKIKARQAEGFA